MSRERWRQVLGRPDYEVSDRGRVRTKINGHRHSTKPQRDGYVLATFGKGDRETMARVVLKAFVGPPAEGDEASHLDGDRTNNRVENLAWEDHATNMRRKHDHGTVRRGEMVNTAKLNAEKVREARKLRAEGWTLARLAARFGVSVSSMQQLDKGATWRHVA